MKVGLHTRHSRGKYTLVPIQIHYPVVTCGLAHPQQKVRPQFVKSCAGSFYAAVAVLMWSRLFHRPLPSPRSVPSNPPHFVCPCTSVFFFSLSSRASLARRTNMYLHKDQPRSGPINTYVVIRGIGPHVCIRCGKRSEVCVRHNSSPLWRIRAELRRHRFRGLTRNGYNPCVSGSVNCQCSGNAQCTFGIVKYASCYKVLPSAIDFCCRDHHVRRTTSICSNETPCIIVIDRSIAAHQRIH